MAFLCLCAKDHVPGGFIQLMIDRCCAGEDDGYLLTYVHDERTGVSELVCYDAKTMSPKPLARVKLPQRVPYGFHSNFMNEQQFRNQLA